MRPMDFPEDSEEDGEITSREDRGERRSRSSGVHGRVACRSTRALANAAAPEVPGMTAARSSQPGRCVTATFTCGLCCPRKQHRSWPASGRIATCSFAPSSHRLEARTLAAFGRHPANVGVRALHGAGHAVEAVGRAQNHRLAAPAIDLSGAEVGADSPRRRAHRRCDGE